MSLEEGVMLKRARKAAGFTQQELAAKLGLSHAPIFRLENGWEVISLSNLRKICDAIGFEVVIRPKKKNG